MSEKKFDHRSENGGYADGDVLDEEYVVTITRRRRVVREGSVWHDVYESQEEAARVTGKADASRAAYVWRTFTRDEESEVLKATLPHVNVPVVAAAALGLSNSDGS